MAAVKFNKGFEGMNQLVATLKKLPANMEQASKELIDDTASGTVYDAVSNLRTNGSVNYGVLMQSIDAIPGKNGLSSLIVARSNYAAPVEFGTKGKVQIPAGLEGYASQFKGQPSGGTMAEFYASILDWVKKKGIGAGENQESIAYAIMISIWKEGQQPHPYFFPSWFKNSKEFRTEIKKMFKRTLLQRLKQFFS